ncbi:hypothetical protein [Streptomyces roseifaciens]|uniref:hypothetical protein n=1 Tax=Streptomyces roseifaciens TaxID=1488406 RepID=UPI000AB94CD2|nr:hypothetical protein [Streptomyces roseifaciens]
MAPDVNLDAVEVTQTVQDLNHSVPLIAGKSTVVRLYLSCDSAPGVTVRGEISVSRSPADTASVVSSLGTVFLDPSLAGNVPQCRNDVRLSLNFRLPEAHTAMGPLHIRVANVVDTATGESLTVTGTQSPTSVQFRSSPPLRVRILGLRYHSGTPPVVHAPRTLDFQGLISWLKRAYPVSRVISSTAIVDANASPPFQYGTANAQLAALRALDISEGADPRTHYYGMVGDGGFFMRGGAAGIPTAPDPGTVASGPAGPADFGWDFDGTYGDWYGAHELAHTFGRLHPGYCNQTEDDLQNYPFEQGLISDTNHGFVGFDVGDPALNIPMAALPGLRWHDVMTYCNFQWLSSYTYEGVRNRLVAEDGTAGAPTGGASPTGATAPGGSGGRPDERFPVRPVVSSPEAASPAGGAAGGAARGAAGPDAHADKYVSVVARANLTTGQGSIQFVNPVSALAAPSGQSAAGGETTAILRVIQAGGAAPREYPVKVKVDSELEPDDDRTGLVDAVVPIGPQAEAIELVIAGEPVDVFQASGPPPALRATRHTGTEEGAMGLALEFDRGLEEEAPTTTYSAQVSTDGGTTWRTIAVGMRDPVIHVDRGQFRPGDNVQVRIITTNGFTSSSAVTESFRV